MLLYERIGTINFTKKGAYMYINFFPSSYIRIFNLQLYKEFKSIPVIIKGIKTLD